MKEKNLITLSKGIDVLSAFFANRKGLLPLLGIAFTVFNYLLVLFVPGFFAETNFFLHLGIIIAIAGFVLAWAL